MLGINRGVHFFVHASEVFFKCLVKSRIVVVFSVEVLVSDKMVTKNFRLPNEHMHGALNVIKK